MKETKMKRMEAKELQPSATVDWAKAVMEPRVLEKEEHPWWFLPCYGP